MADIDLRTPDIPGYDENRLELTEEVEILVHQIENLLTTLPDEALGVNIGVDLRDLIFTSTISADEIESIINDQIQRYCPSAVNFNVDVEVQLFQGTQRDIGVVNILVDNTKVFGLLIK